MQQQAEASLVGWLFSTGMARQPACSIIGIKMECDVHLAASWVNAEALEQALASAGAGPHAAHSTRFYFPTGCRVMIDSAVRLLSLCNQLDKSTRRVRLDFEEGESGAMGYLSRMGFFDELSRSVEVAPAWPPVSGAEIHGGSNPRLVEIARINHRSRDQALPGRLTDALVLACGRRSDAKDLDGAAFTVFAELIDNVFSHSETPLDGYAALQVYSRGASLQVAVSDSGRGIMETLRPALMTEYPRLARLSDTALLVEVFRQGLSRHGADRGCGLRGSAAKAIKYRADLDVRLPNTRVVLKPGQGGYRPATAYCHDQLPLLWGTHICFTFRLD